MPGLHARRKRILLTLALLLAGPIAAQAAVAGFIIDCETDCAGVAAAVAAIPGGRVVFAYENVSALAVEIPAEAVGELQNHPEVADVVKDLPVAAPQPELTELPAADGVQALSAADIAALPADYSFNNDLIGATSFHAGGTIGAGVVVGVIDTGTANAPTAPAIAGSVVGGENFVPLAQDPVASATSRFNGAHGTQVGTMIAGHVAFVFSNASVLVQSLLQHAPSAVIPFNATQSLVPMVGSAPGASLYAYKVFPSGGGGAPESRIIAAMDRAITQRRNFNDGVPSVPVNAPCGAENTPCVFDSLNVEVVNMSLGGGTLFAARNLEDELTEEMLEVGITPVIASGNDGPGAATVASPGTGRGALTVAAASTTPHERVLRDVQFGLGIGALYRASTHTQTATFSSRGPSADGRYSVNVTSNGFANFVQGANGGLSLASGTSFATPTTSGAAALLVESHPAASAVQIRNAIIAGADSGVLGDNSKKIDQGAGFLDVPAASAKLAANQVGSGLASGWSTPSVALNWLPLGISPVYFKNDKYTAKLKNLKPGETRQFYVRTFEDWTNLAVTVKNIVAANPPAAQNQLFGDDIMFSIVDAPTSFSADRVPLTFVFADTTFQVPNPQTGLVRVTVGGDWTNAGLISADLEIVRTRSNLGSLTALGSVEEGEEDVVQINVPAGTGQLSLLLTWLHDWGVYPTSDVDLIAEDPNGNLFFGAATIASPERLIVNSPTPGTWTLTIQGFEINGLFIDEDVWTLRARADGVHLPKL